MDEFRQIWDFFENILKKILLTNYKIFPRLMTVASLFGARQLECYENNYFDLIAMPSKKIIYKNPNK